MYLYETAAQTNQKETTTKQKEPRYKQRTSGFPHTLRLGSCGSCITVVVFHFYRCFLIVLTLPRLFTFLGLCLVCFLRTVSVCFVGFGCHVFLLHLRLGSEVFGLVDEILHLAFQGVDLGPDGFHEECGVLVVWNLFLFLHRCISPFLRTIAVGTTDTWVVPVTTTTKSYRALLQYTNHSYISYSIFFLQTFLCLCLPACLSRCTPNPFFWHTDTHVHPPSSVHPPHPPQPLSGALMYTFWCTPPLPLDVHFLPPSHVPMYTWCTLSPSWCHSDVRFVFDSHGLKRGQVFFHRVCFSSGWSLIRVFPNQGGPSSGWSLIWVPFVVLLQDCSPTKATIKARQHGKWPHPHHSRSNP